MKGMPTVAKVLVCRHYSLKEAHATQEVNKFHVSEEAETFKIQRIPFPELWKQ